MKKENALLLFFRHWFGEDIQPNKWHGFGIAYDGKETRFYVDGVLKNIYQEKPFFF